VGGWLVWSQPPNSHFWIGLFLLMLFFALFLTAALIFNHSGRGLLLALFTVSALLLRLFQIGHPLNLAILAAIFIILGIALAKTPPKASR